MSYSGAFASVYDAYTDDVEYGKRADYIHGLLLRNGIKGGILLDLCCGTGSFSVEFSKRGYEVIGVDSSPDMLSAAGEKARNADCDILFLCQDAGELDLYGTVDFCICCLDSVNHFDGLDTVRAAMEKVSLFTVPGGLFIFDVNTPYKHKKILSGNNFVYNKGESLLIWQNSVCSGGVVDMQIDIMTSGPDGRYDRFTDYVTETAYPLRTIKRALKDNGFGEIRCYDDMSFSKPRRNSERVYFVAKKVR